MQSTWQASSRGQASSWQDNKSHDEEDKNDDENISFYLKVGNTKNNKLM